MVRKILNAASWLGLVQAMNVISVIVLSVFVIRQVEPAQVSSYMYAVFTTDAVLSYTLLQIGLRITLAKDDATFKRLFEYGRRFSFVNAVLAVVVVTAVMFSSNHVPDSSALHMMAWLTVAGLANYFAQVCFSVCDYTFNYKTFGVSSAVSNILSLLIAVGVFLLGGGIASMVVRDVARSLILLALAVNSSRSLVPQGTFATPMNGREKLAFIGFLAKRHTLKILEVTNHRVPALITSAGSTISLGHFGVAFQLISQIMNVLTIAGDKLAYAFFARAERQNKLRYLAIVMALYAATGLTIFVIGERLFTLIYGAQWLASATTFSYLGIYLFTHGVLGLVTNFLITEHRFAGVYLAWGGWTATFLSCFLYDKNWPIVTYYLAASAVSCFLGIAALFWAQRQFPSAALQRAMN
jgi:hypothetical protein